MIPVQREREDDMAKAVYYHTGWATYGRNFQIKDLPKSVGEIVYAFYNLLPSGEIASLDSWADTEARFTTAAKGMLPLDTWSDASAYYGNFGQIKKLQATRPLKATLSIGGWSRSQHFSTAVKQAATRQVLVDSIVSFLRIFPIFTGVSLDWEYLSSNNVNYGLQGNTVSQDDSRNFVAFLETLRKVLPATHTIAFCCTADPNKAVWDVEKVHPYIDELHVMTYDFHDGAWGELKTAFHTNPRKSKHGTWSCEEAADYYLKRGVPSHKLFIGAALYSRGFANTKGPGLAARGGSLDSSWETGVVDYKVLPLAGATEYNDPESWAAYSYDPVKGVVNTYDNPRSILEKCKIVHERALGGIVVWETAGDAAETNPRCLANILAENLRSTSTADPVVKPPVSAPAPAPAATLPPPAPTLPPAPVVITTPVPTPTNVKRPWSAGESYEQGTLLVYRGQVYTTLQHVPAQLPASVTPETATGFFALVYVSKGSEPAWNTDTWFSKDSIVKQSGGFYRALVAHKSQVDWAPTAAPSLWQRLTT